ncbi:hypothetical protein GOP47_0014897, partial [Adiantum capillus-veneris]
LLRRDKPIFVGIEPPKCLPHILIVGLLIIIDLWTNSPHKRLQTHEFLKAYHTISISVHLLHHFPHFSVTWVVPKPPQGHPQLDG